MEHSREAGLRTRVYVDGYNLYYGRLKHTLFKWLDLEALIQRVLPSILYKQDGAPIRYRFETPAIKYFTAPILSAFAKAAGSVSCQAHYHSALREHLGTRLQIIEGYHDPKPARAHLLIEGRAARDCDQVEIWKLEEKQSDVGLALHAFSDAVRGEADQVIVVTNDSDFVPAMQMIREHTRAVLGLIVPARPGAARTNTALDALSHWTRESITDEELTHGQLPPMVRRANQPVIHKPTSWYPRPDLLEPILAEATRVKRNQGSALKWLNQPCERLGNRVPIEMAAADESAAELRAYMEQYAREFGI